MRQTKVLEARDQAAKAAKVARLTGMLQESAPMYSPFSQPSPADRSIEGFQLGPVSRPVETSARDSDRAPDPEIRVTQPPEPDWTEAAQGFQSGLAFQSGSALQSVENSTQGLLCVPASMRRQRTTATTTPFPPPPLILGSTQGSRRGSASRNLWTPVQHLQPAPGPMPLEVSTGASAPSQTPQPVKASTRATTASQTPQPATDTKYRVRDRKSKMLGRRKQYKASEDDSILRGFETHGRQWQVVQADESLGLGHRTTTGLRKRFSHLCGRRNGSRRHPTKPEEEGAADALFRGSTNPSKRLRREIPPSEAPVNERVQTRAADDVPSGEPASLAKRHNGKASPSASRMVSPFSSPSTGPRPKAVARQAHLASDPSLDILVAVGGNKEIQDTPRDIIRRKDCDLYDDEVADEDEGEDDGEDEDEDTVKLDVDGDSNPACGLNAVAVARWVGGNNSATLAAHALKGREGARLASSAPTPTASAPPAMSEAQYVAFVDGLLLTPTPDYFSRPRATSSSTRQVPTEMSSSISLHARQTSPCISAGPTLASSPPSPSGRGASSSSTLHAPTMTLSPLAFRHTASSPYPSAGPTSAPSSSSFAPRMPSSSALQVPSGAPSLPCFQTRKPTPCTSVGPTSTLCSLPSPLRGEQVSTELKSAPSESSAGRRVLPYVSPSSKLLGPPTFPPSDATMPAPPYGGPVSSGGHPASSHTGHRSLSASGPTPVYTCFPTYNTPSAFHFDPRWSAAAITSGIDSTSAGGFQYLYNTTFDRGSEQTVDYEPVKCPQTVADDTTAGSPSIQTGCETILAEVCQTDGRMRATEKTTSVTGVHTPTNSVPAKISEKTTDVNTIEAIT